MSIPDFTVVLAVDLQHLAELEAVFPTWIMHSKCLHNAPMVVMRHPSMDSDAYTRAIHAATFGRVGKIVTLPEFAPRILNPGPADLMGHREFMLSSFVLHAHKHIHTPYYLKIDTDCIYRGGPEDWIDPAWFKDSPVLIAPSWGYTKPNYQWDDLDRWAETVPPLASHPCPHREVVGDIVKCKRISSYVQFGRTDWTREVAGWCGSRMPVPSQDGLLSYCAERGRYFYRRIKFPQWEHVGGGGRKLLQRAMAAMGAI